MQAKANAATVARTGNSNLESTLEKNFENGTPFYDNVSDERSDLRMRLTSRAKAHAIRPAAVHCAGREPTKTQLISISVGKVTLGENSNPDRRAKSI